MRGEDISEGNVFRRGQPFLKIFKVNNLFTISESKKSGVEGRGQRKILTFEKVEVTKGVFLGGLRECFSRIALAPMRGKDICAANVFRRWLETTFSNAKGCCSDAHSRFRKCSSPPGAARLREGWRERQG